MAISNMSISKSLADSKLSLYSYVRARSALYSLEGLLAPTIEAVMNLRRPRLPIDDVNLFRAARAELERILRADVENINAGVYPVEVLKPENPVRHLARIPRMLAEGVRIARRRKSRDSKQFSDKARELLQDAPEYYRRNFHFQGDGYLSDESAELYDHQVDVLFAGATDAMRRLLIKPLRERFGFGDGEGLTFLELGVGTGRATLFVRLAFPKAKIVAIDLSAPYLKRAQRRLHEYARHDFLEANASELPFKEARFDAVYSVFLFHELPEPVRIDVLRESMRVLKPSGFIGLVDSLQLGDSAALDTALKQFPVEFHEPFYRNYIESSVEQLFENVGLRQIQSTNGFFSKVVWAEVV